MNRALKIALALGIWATGLLIYTLLLKVAIPILDGDFHVADDGVGSYISDQLFIPRQESESEEVPSGVAESSEYE